MSLLGDSKYVDLVKFVVKRVTTQYSIINEDPDFFINVDAETLHDFYASSTPESLQNHNLKINPQLFLDILLLEIRRETIHEGKKKEWPKKS